MGPLLRRKGNQGGMVLDSTNKVGRDPKRAGKYLRCPLEGAYGPRHRGRHPDCGRALGRTEHPPRDPGPRRQVEG